MLAVCGQDLKLLQWPSMNILGSSVPAPLVESTDLISMAWNNNATKIAVFPRRSNPLLITPMIRKTIDKECRFEEVTK